MQVTRGILIRLFHCCQRMELAEIQCVCFALEYFTVPFAVVKSTARYIFDEKPTNFKLQSFKNNINFLCLGYLQSSGLH